MMVVWRRRARQTTDSPPDGQLVLPRENVIFAVLDRFGVWGVWGAECAFCNVVNTLERDVILPQPQRPLAAQWRGYVIPR